MNEFNKVLNNNEKIFWEGKPSFWPFLLGGSLFITLFGMFWLGITIPTVLIASSAASTSLNSLLPMGFLFVMPHFWIGIAMTFGPIAYKLLVFKKVRYAITDRRVLVQGGVIGRDFQFIDFDQITNAEVNVGVFDTLLNQGKTGTIAISSAGTFVSTKNGAVAKPYNLSNVENPYEVFKLLKGVSMDVKTDIQYPNKLRPEENPGYKTNYDHKGLEEQK